MSADVPHDRKVFPTEGDSDDRSRHRPAYEDPHRGGSRRIDGTQRGGQDHPLHLGGVRPSAFLGTRPGRAAHFRDRRLPACVGQARAPPLGTYGKSDPIDAACVARAALREPSLPLATPAGPEHDVRLLADHRDDLVEERQRIIRRLRWNCHDLEVALELPPRVLDRYVWLDKLEAALGLLPESMRRRIAIDQVRRCRELTADIRALEREIREHVRVLAPELTEVPGCSALSAAHLVGQTGTASRFRSEAAFAMHVGTAPLAVSSGKSERHRLNRTGNRTLNSTVHIIAVTQARMHPPAIAYIERKRAEGMSTREALRCLKRHITRTLYKTMLRAERARGAGVVHVDFSPVVVAEAV